MTSCEQLTWLHVSIITWRYNDNRSWKLFHWIVRAKSCNHRVFWWNVWLGGRSVFMSLSEFWTKIYCAPQLRFLFSSHKGSRLYFIFCSKMVHAVMVVRVQTCHRNNPGNSIMITDLLWINLLRVLLFVKVHSYDIPSSFQFRFSILNITWMPHTPNYCQERNVLSCKSGWWKLCSCTHRKQISFLFHESF